MNAMQPNKPPHTPEEHIAAALDHVEALKLERKSRTPQGHPDSRVPGEIGRTMKNLGKIRTGLLEQKERFQIAIERIDLCMGKIDDAFVPLEIEMRVATYRLRSEDAP